jgi:hypothetical protein
MKKIICKKCNKEMEYLGNISCMVYLSNPPQWDEVYVCRHCETKETVREYGSLPPDNSFANNFIEQ